MTMVRLHRRVALRTGRVAGLILGAVWGNLLIGTTLPAQSPPVHFQHAGVMSPGAIGNLRLQQGGPLSGYYQPVRIRAPQGVLVAPAAGGRFIEPRAEQFEMGLLIGSVYRLKVTRIPKFEGFEVYPSVEVIDRLFPPRGEKWRFPIPIDLTQRELELALRGKFVTRVIYLEDPDRALPLEEDPGELNWFEIAPGENPVEVADRLGRPVAILRIGGRLPDSAGPTDAFLFGSPPWTKPSGP